MPAAMTAPDGVLRHDYSARLRAAAEDYLCAVWEHTAHPALAEGAVPGVLVVAALHVITGVAWEQPSDEQVRAAMALHLGIHDDDA